MCLTWVELSGLEPLTSCMPCPADFVCHGSRMSGARTSGHMQCLAGSGAGRGGLGA